ncbi:hypothetical protein LWI28_011237 [Acer negundo]|uniref:Uncharacterized protein n=1 Tax=Acer negundo TaxID=4023 RepID=A0AAD5P526_ACENE|nr:hypothetical protein LWI28_011237 [Acer negundo]
MLLQQDNKQSRETALRPFKPRTAMTNLISNNNHLGKQLSVLMISSLIASAHRPQIHFSWSDDDDDVGGSGGVVSDVDTTIGSFTIVADIANNPIKINEHHN